MDRQCSSCGGFCRKSGCERENVEPTPDPIYTAPPQQETQEPVAFLVFCDGEIISAQTSKPELPYGAGGSPVIPVYTAPQQEKQEPVAWMHPTSRDCVSTQPHSYRDAIPLYRRAP